MYSVPPHRTKIFVWTSFTLVPLILTLLRLQLSAYQNEVVFVPADVAMSPFNRYPLTDKSENIPTTISQEVGRRKPDALQERDAADPRALQRGRNEYRSYWEAIEKYGDASLFEGVRYGGEVLSQDYICAFGPGRGIEEDSGYKLLVEKLRIARTALHSPRVFCGIYTYSGMRALARTQALSWGYKCDGFLAFSNETIPELGIVDLHHTGEESYWNMWQKTRSIWKYIYDHFLEDYDYFHLGGDDMYLLVENMRRYLKQLPNDQKPRHFGQWLPSNNMISGGPGYTLNMQAVKSFVEKALPHCEASKTVPYEDRMISKCLQSIGIFGNDTDTRDVETGEQQYHNSHPALLYSFRGNTRSYQSKIASQWESLPHPTLTNETVGPRNELQAIAPFSISFHNLYNPQSVARFHAIVYHACPENTPLGKAVESHQRS